MQAPEQEHLARALIISQRCCLPPRGGARGRFRASPAHMMAGAPAAEPVCIEIGRSIQSTSSIEKVPAPAPSVHNPLI
eukprot:scaffold76511_cov32-Tisochrysis_lutea.AAC.1